MFELFHLIGASICVALGLIDVRKRRLPDALVMGLAVAVALAYSSGSERDIDLIDLLTGGLRFGVPLLAVHLITPGGLGFGDVKLGFVLGAAIGLHDETQAVAGLFVAFVAAMPHAIWLLIRQRRNSKSTAPDTPTPGTLPFGLYLVAGAAVVIAINWSG